MRVAAVGHRTYFENHFPENWKHDDNARCLNVSEGDYSWLIILRNFRPEITLFFRPELYPNCYLRNISGIRVALLSEPLPNWTADGIRMTDETSLRLRVYRGMSWSDYHWRIYYDSGKENSAAHFGFEIDEFRPLPIDTNVFRPRPMRRHRPIDVCFVGKATRHRIAALDFLRSGGLRFLWVAHGVQGGDLARLFQRSSVVLNVHADGMAANEPRLYLAAACGCRVVSEPLSSPLAAFHDRIVVEPRPWNDRILREHVVAARESGWTSDDQRDLQRLSTRKLVEDLAIRFGLT
jgi:hypothetical protein